MCLPLDFPADRRYNPNTPEGRRALLRGAVLYFDRQEGNGLEIHEEIDLQDCPFCGGAGLLEEEEDWCWYVMCMDCGAQTGHFEYKRPEDRESAARSAANVWNIGKVVRSDIGE